jgi:hypothetical protein
MGKVEATTIDPVTIQQLVREAELIFEGVVTRVEYRVSDVATPSHVALPHTFVTFAIEQTLQGSTVNDRSITLRFQGGSDGNGSIMLVPGIPLFDVGDRDILFVRGNGEHLCPLVGWEQGRFRVIGGLVYTDNGQEVWLTRRGTLAFGPSHALEEVLTHNLAGTALTFEVPSVAAARTPPTGRQWLNADGFKNTITGLVGQLQTHQQLTALPPVASADIQKAFYVRVSPPEPPPPVPPSEGFNTQGEPAPAEEGPQQTDGEPRLDKQSR